MGCVSLGKCYPVLFEDMADFPRNEVKINRLLMVNGRLHVKGDLKVSGSVIVANGGELLVDGKRSISGRVQGVIGT